MCGISGIFQRRGKTDSALRCKKMLSVIEHRGPDAEGIISWENITLGHRRLSIIDLTPEGNQPMDYMGRYCITYNGEIYNYIELKEELKSKGYQFSTNTDTEVIMAAYDYWGRDCLNHFNGMWAFAILDKKEKIVYISRDRYGIKPLYYYLDEEELLIASEIKQILEVRADLSRLNHQKAKDFLYFGFMDYDENTFFKDIKSLTAGHSAVYDIKKNDIQISQWYVLPDNTQHISYCAATNGFRTLFFDSVKLRKRADVPIGSCLSGGLDSSAIVCAYCADNTEPIKTISSCYSRESEKIFDEQIYIDDVVHSTGAVSNKTFLSYDEAMKDLDTIIWHMDEPFTTMSICAQYKVFKEAKRLGLTVMMDGQGADEQLAGYTSFILPSMIEDLNHNRIMNYLASIKFLYKRGKSEDTTPIRVALKAILNSKWGKWYVNTNNTGNSHMGAVDLEEGTKHDFFPNHNFQNFTKDMMQINLQTLLHFEDRNSMAHSIETRLPFMDYRLVEHNLTLPSNYRLRWGYTKSILRDSMRGTLPENVRKRISKLGFAAPEDIWQRENDRYITDELNEACGKLSTFLQKDEVRKWHAQCIENGAKDAYVFRILCMARWMQIFDVKE